MRRASAPHLRSASERGTLGNRVAAILAGHFGSIDALEKADVDEISSINEIGPIIAQSVQLNDATYTIRGSQRS